MKRCIIAPALTFVFAWRGETQEIDPTKTINRVAEMWKDVVAARMNGNEVLQVECDKKVVAELAKLKGKMVDFEPEVLLVQLTGGKSAGRTKDLVGQKPGISLFPLAMNLDKVSVYKVRHLLHARPFDPNDKRRGYQPFVVEKAPWVLALKTKDRVRLQGKIAEVRLDRDVSWQYLNVNLMLSEVKLSPRKN